MINLTPEQLEFLFYLLGALFIGFFFGYLLAKARARNKYMSEIDELSDLLDNRDREIETASAKHVQLKQHMAVQANEIQDLGLKVTGAQDVISKLEDSSKLIKDEKLELASLIDRKDEQLAESYNEINTIKSVLDTHKQEKEDYSSKLQDTSKEIEHHAKVSSELSQKNTEYQVKISKLEENLQIEKELTSVELKKQTHHLTTLKEENEAILKTIEDKNRVIASLESKNSELSTRGDEVKKQTQQLNSLKDENVALKQKYENVIKIIEDKNAEISSLETKSKDMMNKDDNYNILQNALEDSKNEIHNKEKLVSDLELKVHNLEGQVKIVHNKESSNNDALKNELQKVKDDLLQKENALKMVEDKLRVSHEETKKVHRELETRITNEKTISQLAGNDKPIETWGLGSMVKNVFGNKDKN